MTYSQQDYIVKTSKGHLYIFYINNENLMIRKIDTVEKLDYILFKEKVLNYALDIDNNDVIHIVYLSKTGSVYYTTYPHIDYCITLDSLTKYLPIKYLNIRAVKSGVHIFYRTSNLYKNKGFICHNYLHNNILENKLLLETNSPHYICPYFLDSYDNDLYMLYCNDYKEHRYILKKFNLQSNLWYDFEDNITIENINNLNFFITPYNTGIIAYDKLSNNSIQTLLRYKNFDSNKSSWSKNMYVSDANANILNLIVFSEGKKLHMMWNENGNIVYKTSKDLINWKKKPVPNSKNVDIDVYTYISNDLKNRNSKINNIYFSSKFSSINMELTNASNTNTNSLTIITNKPHAPDKLNISLLGTMPNSSHETIMNENDQIKSLVFENIPKDKIISQLLEKNLTLEKELQSLYTCINEYKYTINKQKSDHYLENKKFQTEINTYKNKIYNLKEKNNKLYIESNKKNQELFKIIEEKEKLLQDLWEMIKK